MYCTSNWSVTDGSIHNKRASMVHCWNTCLRHKTNLHVVIYWQIIQFQSLNSLYSHDVRIRGVLVHDDALYKPKFYLLTYLRRKMFLIIHSDHLLYCYMIIHWPLTLKTMSTRIMNIRDTFYDSPSELTDGRPADNPHTLCSLPTIVGGAIRCLKN